jgi:hypothetical protein
MVHPNGSSKWFIQMVHPNGSSKWFIELFWKIPAHSSGFLSFWKNSIYVLLRFRVSYSFEFDFIILNDYIA